MEINNLKDKDIFIDYELNNLPKELEQEEIRIFIKDLLNKIRMMVQKENRLYSRIYDPEFIGIGISGYPAFDYSGNVVRIENAEEIEYSRFENVFTGDWNPTFVEHNGRGWISYEDFIYELSQEFFLNFLLPYNHKELNDEELSDWSDENYDMILAYSSKCSEYINSQFDFSNIGIDYEQLQKTLDKC